MPGVPLVGPPVTEGSGTPLTATLTSTPPSSPDELSALEELDDEGEEEDGDEREADDDELLLGSEGIEGWPDEDALGIDGLDGEEEEDDGEGIDGAELGEEEDELGIEGMELLELLELEVVSHPTSNSASADTVSRAFMGVCVTGVLMLLFLLTLGLGTQGEREKFGVTWPGKRPG